ncbi:uncharacterized protein LOC128128015 [Lactuca sativa]|uniref:uncharacterized protein LOC128128015 n=1 Tax=Lactuca sativa TaxID=4236 RepID=UPI0022AE798B|nr:uncharacterized protein LOC128128015 [Lactuca sativa]
MTTSGQAFIVQQPQIQTFNVVPSIPHHQTQNVPFSIPQTISAPNVLVKASSSNSKESDENLALATGLVNFYNAFVAGDPPPQLSFADLDQIHPEDVEEMDITWQIAIAVFRAKQFAKKIGKNNWAMNADKKVGFNKSILRCFNCHEQALNISRPENAHLAQIDDNSSKNTDVDPEAEMMELQLALMVSSSSEPKKREDVIYKEPHLRYGQPASFVSRGFINIESTNVSTSSADQPLDQTERVSCVDSSSDTVEFNFFDMFDELFNNSDACDSHEESSILQVKTNEAPSLISQPNSHAFSSEKSKSVCQENKSEKCNTSSSNKHICFNYGVGGHIARNCQNRIFVNYLSPRGENESRGRSLIRKSSRARSRNNDQKDDKVRKRASFQSNKEVFTNKAQNSFPKPNKAPPRSVSSKSNSRSSTSFGRTSRKFVQTSMKPTSKSPENGVKPKLQWRPKSLSNPSLPPSERQLRRNVVHPWYVDSGCSRHMTGDISQLSEIQSFNGVMFPLWAEMVERSHCAELFTNGVLSFKNVNYAPELKHNLLSISQICDKGYSTHLTDKECMILKPGIVILEEWILVKSKRDGNAYIIDMNNNLPEQVTCLFSKVSKQNAMLWHRRLGHANAKNLNRLAKNEMVRGLPMRDFITFEKCVSCAQGKHHRKPHLPKQVNFVFFLSNKAGVVDLIKKFMVMIEKQANNQVKALRTDNGTKFKNSVLDHFCA